MKWSLLIVGLSLVIVLFTSESQSQFVRRRRKKLVVPPHENNSPRLYPERRGKSWGLYPNLVLGNLMIPKIPFSGR